MPLTAVWWNSKSLVMKRLFLLLAATAAAGCTILEDRNICPSYLTVDMSGVDKGIKEWHMWLFNDSGELLHKDTIHRRDYSVPYVAGVPREEKVRCFMWGNIRGATSLNEDYSLGTFLLKEDGLPADSLYCCTDMIDTSGEESYLKVLPCKEFATVDIYMDGWIGVDYQVRMTIQCASSGFFVDRRMCGGTTETDLEISDIGNYYTRFSGRILRQYDTENLLLKLHVKELLANGEEGELLYDMSIPIGDYLEENGYNMYEGGMEDISMELDFSYNRFLIRAEDWSAEYKIVEEM